MNRNITIDAQHESATDAVLLKGRTELESTQDEIAADYVSRSQEKVVVHEVQSHADMVSSNMVIDFLLAHGHDDAQLERCSAPNRRKGVKQNAEVLGLMRAELERTEQEHAELERAVRAAWMCVERARIDLERSERTHAGLYRAMEVAWARVKFSREELAANTAPPSSDNERQRHETFNKHVSERQLAAQELTQPHELTTTMEVDESAAQERAANDLAAEKRAAEEREAQKRAAEEREAHERAIEKRAAEEREAQERAAEERRAQKRAAEEREAHERAIEKRAAEEREAQERAAEERESYEHADTNRKEQSMRNGDVRLAILADILRRTPVSNQTRIFMTQILFDDRVTTALPQLRSPMVSSMFQEIIAECVSRGRHLHSEVIRSLIEDRCFCEDRKLEALQNADIFMVKEFADQVLKEQRDLLAYLMDARDGVSCSFDRPVAGMVYDHVKRQVDVIAPPSALPDQVIAPPAEMTQDRGAQELAAQKRERRSHERETAVDMRNNANQEFSNGYVATQRSTDNSPPPGESDVRVAILAAVHRQFTGDISQTMNHDMAEILYDERVTAALPQLRSPQLSMMFQEVIAECISRQRPLYSEAIFDLIRRRYFSDARHLQVLRGLQITTAEEFADQTWEGQRDLLAFLKNARDGVMKRSESAPQRPYDHTSAQVLYESVKRQVDVIFLSSPLSKRPSRGSTSHKLDYGQQLLWEKRLREDQQTMELQRLAQRRLGQRLEQQRIEQQRLEQHRIEQQRIEQQREEQQRQQQQREEQQRQQQQREEQQRQQQQREEQQRQQQQREEQQRQQQQREEQQRQQQQFQKQLEQQHQQRLGQRIEQQRIEQQREEQQRQQQQREEQQRQQQQREEQQRQEQQRSQQVTFYKGGQFTPGGGRAPAGGVWLNNNHQVQDDDEDDLGTAFVSVSPKFYKGGQFIPGGGRAPAGGVWM